MKKTIVLLGILAAVGAMQYFMQTPPGSSGQSELGKNNLGVPNPRHVCRRREKKAYQISQEALRQTLKAPRTAIFPSQPTSIVNTDLCKYSVVAYFDAQNINAALLRSRYSVDLGYDHVKQYWYAGTPYVQDYSLTNLKEPKPEEIDAETLLHEMSEDMKACYVYGKFCNKLMPDVATDNLEKLDVFQKFFTGSLNLVDRSALEKFEAKHQVGNNEASVSLTCATLLEKHTNAYNANATKYNASRSLDLPFAPLLANPDWQSYD